jgi:hypothetical protein
MATHEIRIDRSKTLTEEREPATIAGIRTSPGGALRAGGRGGCWRPGTPSTGSSARRPGWTPWPRPTSTWCTR